MQVFYGDGKDWVLISQPEANVLNVLQHICPPGPRRIRYSIFRTNVDQEEPLAPNAFAAMMASAHSASNWESLPAIFFNPGNGKERLFNELVAWARDRGCGFRADDNKAHDMLMKIAGVFFKLSGLEGALFERHAPLERKAPAELRQFLGFSESSTSTSHKKKPRLSQDLCRAVGLEGQGLFADYHQLLRKPWAPLSELINDVGQL